MPLPNLEKHSERKDVRIEEASFFHNLVARVQLICKVQFIFNSVVINFHCLLNTSFTREGCFKKELSGLGWHAGMLVSYFLYWFESGKKINHVSVC